MSKKRTSKRLVALDDDEIRLARLLAERLGYRGGHRYNTSAAMREELLKQATDEELASILNDETLYAEGTAS